jgi:iron(III) transport system ATP-binding protein
MLSVTGVAKSFVMPSGTVQAVDDVTFQVAHAQCYALLGPSGCGKTTVLRCIAGLEQAERGRIEIGNRVVSDPAADIFVPVHERSIGMVFQSYAIWPHLDVFENVAYPLRVQRARLSRDEIVGHVTDVLALVGMAEMAQRSATRLSGGQQQRVALARAIVRNPTLLLLDEPLSNLDARLRESMRKELSHLIRQIGITALFVTHDQVEALSIADRVAVMNDGRIVQEGTPAEIYERPNSLFVARFLGAANVLPGRVEAREHDKALVVLDANRQKLVLATECQPGELVDVVLRPEHLVLSTTPPADSINAIPGRVASLAFQGSNVEYDIDLTGGARLRAHTLSPVRAETGQAVWIAIDAARGLVFRRSAGAETA